MQSCKDGEYIKGYIYKLFMLAPYWAVRGTASKSRDDWGTVNFNVVWTELASQAAVGFGGDTAAYLPFAQKTTLALLAVRKPLQHIARETSADCIAAAGARAISRSKRRGHQNPSPVHQHQQQMRQGQQQRQVALHQPRSPRCCW